MDFMKIKAAVAAQFERMQKHPMFRVAVEKGDLWTTYLASFPAGTNPIFRERTEHDCTCCKQFIRAVGDVVAIIDGTLVSVWDVEVDEPAYQAVASAMASLARSKPIANPFLHFERTAGTDKNFEDIVRKGGSTKTGVGIPLWNHFFVNIDSKFVMKKDAIPTKLGEERAAHDVLARSFETITDDAIATVLELIAQNSLYRGEEHKFAVTEFGKLKKRWAEYLLPDNADHYVWTASKTAPASVARIRNTSIGTLLVDLSEGTDLEDAVKKFEAMVAPTNYKRPTALVTKAMIEKAKATVEELGLTSALERRYAQLNDITVNNILFADRSTKKAMTGDVFDDLAASAGTRAQSFVKVEEVPIAKFLNDILPGVESIEVLFENAHSSNLFSLVAPVDPTAGQLFKWGNNFSWSYNGEFADSIKERVKKAGGSVEGDLCCRLAWDYTDDLDFHMLEPGGTRISFNTYKRHLSPNGGMLDLDANGGDGPRADPAENIFYADHRKMRAGVYTLAVNNFNRRSDGAGFAVEIEFGGQIHRIGYEKVLRSRDTVVVAKIEYGNGVFKIVESLPTSQSVRQVWGLPTQTFHRARVVMMSPNFWDLDPSGQQMRSEDKVGNKHYFFVLEGCKNDGTVRGFFNEFLDGRLNPHRKVFEMVGSKMKPADSDEQLSGLGFSSTQRNALTCRVKGKFSRIIKIIF